VSRSCVGAGQCRLTISPARTDNLVIEEYHSSFLRTLKGKNKDAPEDGLTANVVASTLLYSGCKMTQRTLYLAFFPT
jgi:hypothetical protein